MLIPQVNLFLSQLDEMHGQLQSLDTDDYRILNYTDLLINWQACHFTPSPTLTRSPTPTLKPSRIKRRSHPDIAPRMICQAYTPSLSDFLSIPEPQISRAFTLSMKAKPKKKKSEAEVCAVALYKLLAVHASHSRRFTGFLGGPA